MRKRLTAGNAKLDPALACPRLVTEWRLWVPERAARAVMIDKREILDVARDLGLRRGSSRRTTCWVGSSRIYQDRLRGLGVQGRNVPQEVLLRPIAFGGPRLHPDGEAHRPGVLGRRLC